MAVAKPPRERLPRPRPEDRARGPALAVTAAGPADVVARVERQLAQCRRARTVLALLRIGVEAILPDAADGISGPTLADRVGDEVAHRVCARLRGGDLVLREGRRDLWVLLPDVGAEAARRVALRFERALNGAYSVDGRLVQVGVRVGTAAYPQDGATAVGLTGRACAGG